MLGKKMGGESGTTLIATNCEISGDVHFSDHLLVNGTIKGNIIAQEGSKAVVTISEKGRVKGDIYVPKVIINGKVFGDIHSDKHIELAAKAEIKGNVYYNLIEMVMGSRVDGSLVHAIKRKAGSAKEVAQPNRTAAVTPVKTNTA
ncbi:MAG: cytoskeletal protein CcmA (bactofilin family) [Candidatus Azotimanducaceae bacterium]